MFAKIFTTNRSFDPSELARLPELEASAQLALLDQYAAYCKDHERSANEGTLAQALLAPHDHLFNILHTVLGAHHHRIRRLDNH